MNIIKDVYKSIIDIQKVLNKRMKKQKQKQKSTSIVVLF